MTSPTGPSPDRPPRGGFTLLELIAVLVLISTVLAIAAPSLRGFVHGRQTANVAGRLLSLTHLARSQAISQGSIHRLNIDVDAGEYWLTRQEGGAFVEIDGALGRPYRLPVGVSIALDLPAQGEAPQYVEFHPDGRCDAVTIELSGGEGDLLRLICPSPSERFRVVSAVVEEGR